MTIVSVVDNNAKTKLEKYSMTLTGCFRTIISFEEMNYYSSSSHGNGTFLCSSAFTKRHFISNVSSELPTTHNCFHGVSNQASADGFPNISLH